MRQSGVPTATSRGATGEGKVSFDWELSKRMEYKLRLEGPVEL